MYECRHEGATLRFNPSGPGLYTIYLLGHPGASGAAIKKATNDAFGWMFVNTDALVLRGTIDADNRRCLVMCPHFIGRLQRGDKWHTFTVALAHWAQVYGIERALSEMRAAGQAAKADKLEAAAKAAGVL